MSPSSSQNGQGGGGAAYGFDTNFSSMGLRAGGGSGVGLSHAGMRATTAELDGNDVAALRADLGLPDAAPNVGWQLADLGLRFGGSTGGYGPALRLGNMSASPLRTVPVQATPVTTDPGVIDYADYAERFTEPGVDLGNGDLLKTVKDAALSKLVEWGATSPEGSAWRRAMGVSYALTDAALPGGYGEAAVLAGAGPLIGKGIALGSSALNATAGKYALTSWAAEDLGAVASRVGERLGANWAAPRTLNKEFGGVLLDLGAEAAPVSGLGINPRLTGRLEAWRSYKANEGDMSLQRWVRATQRQYGGETAGYRSGFASWSSQVDGVHGNSLLARGAHDVYAIREAGTGRVLHFGETGRGYLTRFAEHQRDYAKLGLEIEVNLLRTVDGKSAAKALETRYIQTYTKTLGLRPPYNFSNH